MTTLSYKQLIFFSFVTYQNSVFYGECILNYSENRLLTGLYFASGKMTVQMCVSVCKEKGFSFSGLQERKKCFCGEAPEVGFQWAWLDKCDDNCAGDSKQKCGGSNAMSLYSLQGLNKVEIKIIFEVTAFSTTSFQHHPVISYLVRFTCTCLVFTCNS